MRGDTSFMNRYRNEQLTHGNTIVSIALGNNVLCMAASVMNRFRNIQHGTTQSNSSFLNPSFPPQSPLIILGTQSPKPLPTFRPMNATHKKNFSGQQVFMFD